MKRFGKLLMPVIGVLFFAGTGPVYSSASTELAITTPARDGTEVGCESVVSGTAPALRPGDHLWLFAARKSYSDLGLFWPQGEAEVDPETNTWSITSVYGVGGDIGQTFRIVAATLNAAEHAKLKAQFTKAMTSGRFTPIQLPPTTADPKYRTVRKVSHDGCPQ